MLVLLAGICVIHVATVVMLFVSTIDSSWFFMNSTNTTDIWKACTYVNNTYACSGLPSSYNQDYLRAVQALMILAVIFSCISLFSFVIQLFTLDPKNRFIITGIIHMLCCLCVMSAASIYTAQFHTGDKTGNYGYSYILAWICFALAFINSIIYFILRKKGE